MCVCVCVCVCVRVCVCVKNNEALLIHSTAYDDVRGYLQGGYETLKNREGDLSKGGVTL